MLALALQSQPLPFREGQTLTISVPPDYVVVLPAKHAVPEVPAAE